MTRDEVKTVLRGFIRDFAIDPHDAGSVLERVDENGGTVDAETLGDYLDGEGYPELATKVYEKWRAGLAL